MVAKNIEDAWIQGVGVGLDEYGCFSWSGRILMRDCRRERKSTSDSIGAVPECLCVLRLAVWKCFK